MNRLEKLEIEREIVRNLSCIPIGTKEMVDRHYEREINAIKEYGGSNSDSLQVNLVRIKDMLQERLKEE